MRTITIRLNDDDERRLARGAAILQEANPWRKITASDVIRAALAVAFPETPETKEKENACDDYDNNSNKV